MAALEGFRCVCFCMQVEAVAWNDTLAQGAANWAKYLADNDLFEHAKNIKEGENLYMTSHDSKELCTDATKAFYAEVKDYDYSKPGFSMKTGHFTQVIFFFFWEGEGGFLVPGSKSEGNWYFKNLEIYPQGGGHSL